MGRAHSRASASVIDKGPMGSQCPLWVKSGNAHNEPMMSAFHPIAAEQRTQFYVGFVPIAADIILIRLSRRRGRAMSAEL